MSHLPREQLVGRMFLRVSEVAEITDTDPRTIRRAVELKQIEAVHLSDSTIRIVAAPFWRQAGLDPLTLEPVAGDPPSDSAKAGPASPATASNVHALTSGGELPHDPLRAS